MENRCVANHHAGEAKISDGKQLKPQADRPEL